MFSEETILTTYLENLQENFNLYSQILKKESIFSKEFIQFRKAFLIQKKKIDEALDDLSKFQKENLDLSEEEKNLLDNDRKNLEEERKRIEDSFEDYAFTHSFTILDHYNTNLEIKSGIGGEESDKFVYDYSNFLLPILYSNNFKIEEIERKESSVSYKVIGKNSFKYMKWFSGVHKVKRIPSTDKTRVHTSTIVIIAQPDIPESEIALEIKEEDLSIETCRASGHGGQHINTTDSAVKITHLPSGLSVKTFGERDQNQNKKNALLLLKLKLLEKQKEELLRNSSQIKGNIIQDSLRSAKIFTYDFQDKRFIDHRIGEKYTLQYWSDKQVAKRLIDTSFNLLESALCRLLIKED